MDKTVVTVMKLGNPTQPAPIEVFVSDSTIGTRMALSDFLRLSVAGIGNPVTILTSAQLHKRMLTASEAVIADMKRETVIVAGNPTQAIANANP